MKRFLRGLLCITLCAVLAIGLVPTVYAADGDELRAAKKIISVVCDDSGSMAGDRWTYANYAMQALIAQLNEQDELYITFMSSPNKAVKINMADLPGEVLAMEKRTCPGSTPYKAIETAYTQIASMRAQDKSTQYWLIVTTDGSIGGIPTKNGMNGSVQSVLDNLKSSRMGNGTKLNVAYLAMDAKYKCTPDVANNLHTFTATNPQEIAASLSNISNLISSRLEATPITQVDSKTISFESKLPIYSFSILSHQSTANVVSAATNGEPLNIDRNIQLQKKLLFGNVAVVNAKKEQGKSQVIPAGKYTVTFSEDVDLNNLLVQYEPAIGVKMVISIGGKPVPDFSALQAGMNMSVELIPVIPGTDTPIDLSTLPSGTQWRIDYLVDGQQKANASSTRLSKATISAGENVIQGAMQIPGFSEVIFEQRFSVTEIIYGLTVNQPDDATYPRKDPHKSITADNAVTFTVTNSGVPMTKEELLSWHVALQTDAIEVTEPEGLNRLLRGWSKAGVKYRLNDDGTFTLIPKSAAWIAFAVLAGEYKVTVSINNAPNETAMATFELIPQFSDYFGLLWWIGGFLALIYLLMLIVKKKFAFQTVEVAMFSENADETGSRLSSSTKDLTPFSGWNLLAPSWKPCRMKEQNCGVVLVADGNGKIIVSGESIKKNEPIKAYGFSDLNPEEWLGDLKNQLTEIEIDMGDDKPRRVASDKTLTPNNPLYLSTKSGLVYRIKLLG